MSIDDLVQRFVMVWNERDPNWRRETVQALWAPEGRHLMGSQDVRGHAALEERVTASDIRSVQEGGCYFRPATQIQTLPGVVKFRWDLARLGADEIVSAGVGFLELDAEQRIVCDFLFAES